MYLLLSYNRLSSEPVLFKSFIGLSIKQFDDICKEIESKYTKYEVKRLSSNRKYRIRERKPDVGAGRHFKLDVKNRFAMVLMLYRLLHYIHPNRISLWFRPEQRMQGYPQYRSIDKKLFTHSSKDFTT